MATFVKRVIVGTPVKKVTAGSFDISNIGGVNISGDAGTGQNIGEGVHNDILVYDSSASEYRNLNTLRVLKVDHFTLDSNKISVSFGDPSILDEMYISAPDGVFIDGRLEVDRINQRQLAVFDDSSLTTKFYVDQEIDKVSDIIFEMDDGFVDSVIHYNGESLRIAGGRGLSTRGIKVGNVLTITTDLDSTGADSGTFGSSIRIPVLTTNSRGQVTAISDVAVASLDSISYDSSNGSGVLSINTSDGGLFQTTINLNPFTTTDLEEGTDIPPTESFTYAVTASGNFFYSVTGTDRDGSISGGDPALTVRVGDTLTFNNSVWEDHPLLIKTVAGTGISDLVPGVTGQGTATVTWTPTDIGTYYYQCRVHEDMVGVITVLARQEASQYYSRARFDSALGDSTSRQTIRNYVSGSGDLEYDPTTGVFSVDVQQVYGKDDFDSDLDDAINNSYNIHWYADSNYFDLGIKQDVDSGSYGSATQVPVITVDRYGRVDSIGEILVASVDSTRWLRDSNMYRISTGDGQVFDTVINEFYDSVTHNDTLRMNTSKSLTFGTKNNTEQGAGGVSSTGMFMMPGGSEQSGGMWIYNNSPALQFYSKSKNTLTGADNNGEMSFYIYDRDVGSFRSQMSITQGVSFGYKGRSAFSTDAPRGYSLGGGVYDSVNWNRFWGHAVPGLDSTYDLGDSDYKWRDLYLSGTTINLGGVSLQDSGGSLKLGTTSGGAGGFKTSYLSADSAFISQLQVDSINIGQLNLSNADMDSLYVDQLNASQGDIDSLHVDQLNVSQADVDSLYVDQLNVSQADIDSLYVDNLNVGTISIDNATLGQIDIDSAHITQLDVSNTHIDAATMDSARIENLSVDILNADSVSADFIRFDPVLWDDNSKPTTDEGAVYYNSGPDALVYKPATASPVKIGQDEVTRVYNNTGAMIPRGAPVYVTGATNDFPTIAKAQADDITTIDATIGVLKDSINASSFGLVLNRGLIGRLDTSSYSVGDLLFVSADSAGKFTTTAPTYPNFAYEIGRVLVVDSQGGANVGGCIQIAQQKEFFEQLRVTGSGRIDQNFTIGGNLTVIGSQIQTTTQSLAVDDTVIEMGAGDTIGAAGTTFNGTGQNDGVFIGHYTGDSVVNYHVRIDSAGGTGDTIQWSYDSQYGSLETFDSAGGIGPTEFVLSAGSLVAELGNGVSIKFTAATGHDLADSWNGEASPINVQIGIVGNYNPDNDSHAYSGLIRDPSDNRWKFFQQYLPDPQANVNFGHESLEFAPVQMETLYASTVNADLTGDVTGTVSDISNHSTTQLAEGTNLYYLASRVDSDILDSIATNNLDVATGDISQFTSDSAFITQLNVATADIDTLTSANAILDSAYIGQLNVSQADADSLYVDQLNVTTADIDTLTSADAILDSAYIGQLNVVTGDIDTLTSTNASLDSAYIGQLNVTTGNINNATLGQVTIDSAYITQINVSQGDIDSLHASQLDVDSAYITQLNVSQAHIDSLYADNINLTLVDIDTFTADSAIITTISGDSATFIDIVRSGSPVIAGTYGSASLVPIVTVDSSGFVDSIGTTSVAGVTAFAWDSATSTATISTADGGSYPAIINGWHRITSDLIPSLDSTYDLGDSSLKWKDLYLSGSTINLGNIKLQDSDGGLKVMHTSGVMAQAKVGHIKADSAAFELLQVRDDSNGDYRIENNIVQRTYENRDSLNLVPGVTQDSDGKGLINIYVRTGFKTGQHRYWKQGSSKGYYIAYDSDHLYTDKEIQAPLLDLLPGVTYRFHHSDSSMSSHDIRFYWDNQKSGLLSDSAADITYAGMAGNKDTGNSYAQIKVKDDGPTSFGYQCINHPYMGNLAISNSGAGGRIIGTSSGIKVKGNIEGIIDGGTY